METAALHLVERYGPGILGTARRYSLTPEDAEDAYQRGLEILLTKAPSTNEEDLLPWLRTVVKHEAFAVRRHRERGGVPTEDALDEAVGESSSPDEQAERYERLQVGAEALRRLKPQETRCLLLRAQGYSYRQICQETGWTYTKVNRCLTEGRRSFLAQVTGIEEGAECERLSPLLSALADGEATRQDMLTLRPHLRSCLACRATLREYRSVPARITAAVTPVAGVAGADPPGAVARGFDLVAAWLQERSLLFGMKAQQAVEMASAGKVAAVAASAAALAGSGAAVTSLERDRSAPESAARETRQERESPRAPQTAAVRPPPERFEPVRRRSADPPRAAAARDVTSPAPQRDDGATPAARPTPSPSPAPRSAPAAPPRVRTSAPSTAHEREAQTPPEAAYGL